MKFHLGVVPYLNALPLYWTLRENPEFQITARVPALLAQGLENGEFDAALLPVADHLRGVGDGILGDAIIGATGEVRSVLLFSKVAPEKTATIALDTSSHSSVALTRVLCEKFWKITPQFHHHAPDLEAMLAQNDAALLIGDPALQAREKRGDWQIFDLAEQWFRFTGLPFVFAAWTARRGLSGDQRELLALGLNEARDAGETLISQIAGEKAGALSMETIESYLREAIEFRLTEAHSAGLERFGELGRDLGLFETLLPAKIRPSQHISEESVFEFWHSGEYFESETVSWAEAPKTAFESPFDFYDAALWHIGWSRHVFPASIPLGVFQWFGKPGQALLWPAHLRPFPWRPDDILRAWLLEQDWSEKYVLLEGREKYALYVWSTSA